MEYPKVFHHLFNGGSMNKVVNQWNAAAESYSQFEETSRYSKFCREFISNRFIDVSGKYILDAGCGNGEYVDILSRNGGIVTGCDGSTDMLRIAKVKYPQYEYHTIDLMKALPYEANTFDILLCNLVLMDIDPIAATVEEFYRILKPNGTLFFSIVHPAFYDANWERDDNGIAVSKKVTSYITETSYQQNFWGDTTHYHRSISYYMNTMADAKFIFNRMYEPSVYEDTKIPDIPLYLFIEFSK